MILANITTRREFALLIDVELKELTYVLYVEKVDNLYTTFSIPKKNGGERWIHAPQGKLKYIQRRLKALLEGYVKTVYSENLVNTNVSHAFTKERSIITNARVHKNKKYVINLDLESFFDSFNFGRVRGFFINNDYWKLNPLIATLIAQLTCYNGALPQGAPTSPIITNLICNIMDWHLTKIAKKYKMSYTRYADDLTFSTNDKTIEETYSHFLDEIKNEITKSGFKVNDSKTRFTDRYMRQEVTGLVVNKKISVKKEYYKNTHAMANRLYRFGEYQIDGVNGKTEQLEGRFAFIDCIEKYNNTIDGIKHHAGRLNHREKKYQEFLFYKYFCNSGAPLVVTEGKTDKIYLRTALKQFVKEYPHFIIEKDGEIDYNVSFFKRSDRMEYFFYLSKDGASPLTNIIKSYMGNDSVFQNGYYENLIKKYNIKPEYPVILLYDNEFEAKKSKDDKKPIKMLVDQQHGLHINIDVDELKKKNYVRVIGNLYVQVVPLVKGLQNCEIEDLIFEDLDSMTIDGRRFDRKGKKDPKKYFNKDYASRYIERNADEFGFENFRMLFDIWNEILKDYKRIKEMMDF